MRNIMENINAIRYVLQREDGKFYYRGNTSSAWGFTDDFSDAYLFKTEYHAKQRSFTANPLSTVVRKVKLILED